MSDTSPSNSPNDGYKQSFLYPPSTFLGMNQDKRLPSLAELGLSQVTDNVGALEQLNRQKKPKTGFTVKAFDNESSHIPKSSQWSLAGTENPTTSASGYEEPGAGENGKDTDDKTKTAKPALSLMLPLNDSMSWMPSDEGQVEGEWEADISTKDNDGIFPGLSSSNSAMLQFERNARDMETASCAATYGSRSPISNEDDGDSSKEDDGDQSNQDDDRSSTVVSHSIRSREEDYHLTRPMESEPSISGDEHVQRPVVKCICNSEETKADMILCEACFTWQHTECYYIEKNKSPKKQMEGKFPQVYAAQMLGNRVSRLDVAQHLQTQQQKDSIDMLWSQNRLHFCNDCVGVKNQSFEINASDLIAQTHSDTSLPQCTTRGSESISLESPVLPTEGKLPTERDIQGASDQHLLANEAYTDSGYASNTIRAPKLSEIPGQLQQVEEGSTNDAGTELHSLPENERILQSTEQEDEVRSIYSDASTIPTLAKTRYINGLADDLIQAIQPYKLDDEALEQIFELLPDLLRDFALNLGLLVSSTMHRDVMVFIHKYRRQIAERSKERYSWEEIEYNNVDRGEKMSLDHIMDLWHRSGGSAQYERPDSPTSNKDVDYQDSDDLNAHQEDEREREGQVLSHGGQGIDEAMEEEEDEWGDFDNDSDLDGGLVAYQTLIRGTNAYNSFMNNLRRECTLAPAKPNVMGEIRNAILKALPCSPRISRQRPAETFNISFIVDWDPIAFLQNEEYTERQEDAIERAITLTGSITSAQALTCGGYLRQTWPSTGDQVLDLIKSLVSGGNRASATLPNGSSLSVSHQPSQSQGSACVVWVDAHGTAASLAEIGEQFAWLASALRSSPYFQQVACSKPFIESFQIGHLTYKEDSPEVTYICKIGVDIRDGASDSVDLNGQCWHGLFGRPVVVEGFPIPRRSEASTPGLEIPLNIMAGLAQARRISSFGGKTLMKGFATMLLPMKCIKDVITWHLVYTKNGERMSYLETSDFQTVDVQIPELEKSRHILGWCPEIKSYAGAADACYLIKNSRLPRPSGQGALSNASLSLGRLITGGTPFSEGRKDVRLRRNSYIVRMKWISQKYVILWDVEDERGWLVNGASALLHLVRASLAQDQLDNNFAALCLFSTKYFQEASRLHHTDAALEVLLNPNNLKAKIYPENDDYIRFKAYVEDFSDLLEKMLDYQSMAVNNSTPGSVPRSVLEGWDFTDLAFGRDPIYPREAFLDQRALSWVDFTRSVHAITLFGRSFGEIIQPASAGCSAWAKLPCGRSYLAASATDIYRIMESDGDPYSVPMRLTHDILWYTSKETFTQCRCNGETDDEAHCDLIQVLLPFRLHRDISGICSQLPPKNGAIIFGWNTTHRWFWGDKGDPSRSPNDAGYPSLLRDSRSSDSGIGRSLGSSTSITGSTSLLDEECLTYTHVPTSESEDFKSSSSATDNISKCLGDSDVHGSLAKHYKVGIVCALHIELMAVRASFDKTYAKVTIPREDPNYYALGSIEGHKVVAVCLPHGVYGTNAAADVASNMKRSFPGLKFCLLVGVGAGVPSQQNDIRLGDVVVSTPKGGYSGVLPYDMIKSMESGLSELNGYLCPPPAHLMCAISELESDPLLSPTPLQKYLQQIEERKGQYKHPGVAYDRLFVSHCAHNGDPSNRNCDQCDSAYEIKRVSRQSTHPNIHYGLIASGNQVMKNAKIRDKLSREHNVLCFEMEGAGIMNSFPCLIIRGICDYADSHKNKIWQNYAAATAAAYAKLLLSRLRNEDEGYESEPGGENVSGKRSTTFGLSEDRARKRRKE